MKKKKTVKVTMTVEIEGDRISKINNPIEMEDFLLSTLKDVLNQDRLIIRSVNIKDPLEVKVESIII